VTPIKQLTRQRLGPVGVWIGGPEHTSDRADLQRQEMNRLERLHIYGSIWTGETVGGKDIYAQLGVWLAATERIAVGAGIANVWARAPEDAQAAGATLAEAYPGRFVNGIGIGHRMQADQVGGDYRSPLKTMRRYLNRMDEEAARSQVPAPAFPRVIGAVGPRMLELAAELADGAHPYFVPPQHTADARTRMGPDPLLIPEQSVLVNPSPDLLHAYRSRLAIGTQIPQYRATLLRFGLTDDDMDTANDRFLATVGIAGSPDAVAARIAAHLEGGADHVLISPFGDLHSAIDQLGQLAPALQPLISRHAVPGA
jgi:probable F420-dependent oxidoreductase